MNGESGADAATGDHTPLELLLSRSLATLALFSAETLTGETILTGLMAGGGGGGITAGITAGLLERLLLLDL